MRSSLEFTLFFAIFAAFVTSLLCLAEYVGFFNTFPIAAGFLFIEIIVYGLYIHWTEPDPATTKLDQLLVLMRSVEHQGRNVVVVGKDLPCAHFHVGANNLYLRNYMKSALQSLRVDTVWFIDKAPEEVRLLGLNLLNISTDPRVIYADE